jgi:hypothetical protein
MYVLYVCIVCMYVCMYYELYVCIVLYVCMYVLHVRLADGASDWGAGEEIWG